ncbi:MAG: FtsX-like permease family protein [Desulfovibrio sp.]|nr:MAG: FtsX-like permease family protein [Desulfovibrio sp.]
MRIVQSIRLLLRISRREFMGGFKDFGMFLACLALGVAAVACVGTLSASVDAGLSDNARILLGGDLDLRQIHAPLPGSVLEEVHAAGQVSEFVTMRSMARADDPDYPRSTLIDIKAVDSAYPLYGEVVLSPAMDLTQALARDPGTGQFGVVVDEALLDRLDVGIGDSIRLGEALFEVRAALTLEPDRASSFFVLGLRVIIHMDGLPSTGLVRTGSVLTYHYKVRVDPDLDPLVVKQEIQEQFPNPGWRIRDYSQSSQMLGRVLGNMTLYLTLVGVAALLVGGIGAASGVRSFLTAREASIATFKCLGATRAMVMAAYLLQVLVAALLGCLLGVMVGVVAAWAVSFLLQGILPVDVVVGLYFKPLAVSTLFGLVTTLIFSLWPLSAAGAVSPARLFRGHGDPEARRPSLLMVLAVMACVGLLYFLILWYIDHLLIVTGFSVGILVSVLFFLLLAKVLRVVAARMPRPRDPRLRHAIAGLHRPGSATTSVIFSIGLGLTVLTAVTLTDGNMQHLIANTLPSASPAYFFIDIPPQDIDAFTERVGAVQNVTNIETEPSLRGRIVAIGGVPAHEREIDPDSEWALRSERGLTFAAHMDPDFVITAGEWWDPDQDPTGLGPRICFDADLAEGFGIGVGDTLTVNILGRDITAEIVCLRKIEWTSMSLNHTFIFAPGVLENAPHSYIATVYTTDGALERNPDDPGSTGRVIDRIASDQFPQAVAIDMRDILRDVQDLFRQIGATVRTTAVVTLLAGLLVLAETLRATLKRRHFEAVVFKVLGATRRDIMLSLALEFLLLGASAAVLAAFLGAALSYPFVTWILQQDWVFLPVPLLLITLGGVLATLLLGLTGVRTAVSRKAWPVLRND